MLDSVKRITLGIVVVAIIVILPIVALSIRGDLAGDAGARPSHAGPKKTQQPSAAPTAPPTLGPTSGPSPTAGSQTVAPTTPPSVVLVGAGDISTCGNTNDTATSDLLLGIPGTVFTLGDNVYDNGTATEYANCYGPTWGRAAIKSRTRPVPGNHEYNTAGATGYYGYFGAAAGDPTKGYYAYDAGTWRVYVLNSNCAPIGGCGAGSAQEQWLRTELAANPRSCVLAMWHHPRFSSGEHGSSTATQALYQALYDFDAELVLVGHDHHYERFAPQTATGAADSARGIVQMVVGTGGRSHYATPNVRANSVVRNSDTYGVLKLTLDKGGWTFQFVPVPGQSFTDTGNGTCH